MTTVKTDKVESPKSADLTLQSSTGKKVKFKAGESGTEFTLPSSDGSNGDKLQTDGSGNLTFAPVDEQIFQNALRNNVTDAGTSYYGPRLIKVWDYIATLPTAGLKSIEMMVPTSMASSGVKITKFMIKMYDLTFGYTTGNGQTTDNNGCVMFVLPLNSSGSGMMNESSTAYQLQSNLMWQHSGTSGSNRQSTTSGGKNYNYSYFTGSPSTKNIVDVGYYIAGEQASYPQYWGNVGSSGGNNIFQWYSGTDNPHTKSAGIQMYAYKSGITGDIEILNRKTGWNIRHWGRYNYYSTSTEYKPATWEGTVNTYPNGGQSTSNVEMPMTDHAQGVKIQMFPYNMNYHDTWGLVEGRFELYAFIT